MKKISISLNPTYLCNFRCDFCYLTKEQLADTKKVDIKKVDALFKELNKAGYEIDQVDLYGGEIGLLRNDYLKDLDDVLMAHGDPQLNIITNLYIVNPFFLESHINLSVSFDFEAREKHEQVLSNILSIDKEISILILASKQLLDKNVDEMISTLNSIKNIKSVEIKPYSSNQANAFNVTDLEFEKFVKKWLNSKKVKQFNFVNRDLIEKCKNKMNNSFSDDHLYITPEGKFAVLEFDNNNNEYFLDMNSLSDYEQWCIKEKKRVRDNKICSRCEYMGTCLTEHYRDVKSLDDSCNGYLNLIKEIPL